MVDIIIFGMARKDSDWLTLYIHSCQDSYATRIRCNQHRRLVRSLGTGHVTIDLLPDDVLLNIFHFCRMDGIDKFGITWEWETLVRVCRRWRLLIFESPRGLGLRLVCTRRTPVREMLDSWPAIPIIILDHSPPPPFFDPPISNVVAALKLCHRIYGIWLNSLTTSQWLSIIQQTQGLFPQLMFLVLVPELAMELTLPVNFLGGSTPCLRVIRLDGIRFPALPHLLLSARDLVSLQLHRIPIEGYVSSMAMVAGLSASTNLRELVIEFRSPKSPLDQTILFPRPRRHVVLPALTKLSFRVEIRYFNQLIFHIPQLVQFIKRTENIGSFNQADVSLRYDNVMISLVTSKMGVYILQTSCHEVDWQLSSLAQLCSQLHRLVSRVECLDIDMTMNPRTNWQDNMDAIQWLEFFETFTAVNTLRLGREILPSVLSALEGLSADSAAEVLPALRDLWFDNNLEQPSSVREAIKVFLTARQHSDCTVAVHHWERQQDQGFEAGSSYSS